MNSSLSQILREIKPLDEKVMKQARARQDELTKPRGSLGQLENLSIKIAGIKGEITSGFEHKAIIVMAADHGVVSEGVSLYPQEVTRQMVFNFLNGGAGINVLARFVGARVVIVDMGVVGGFEPHPNLICKMIDFGTRDMAKGPAMTREQALDAIQAGIDVVEGEIARGLDIVGTGDMGIGNTTASSAICAVITGESVEKVTGRGTGLAGEQLIHKVEVIQKALELNRPNPKDPADVLAKVGGFEIGGLAGVMLGAAAHHIPVVIDGFISGAAALIAAGLAPGLRDYLIASHLSAESGHKILLEHLGLSPLLDLGMRLGEGTGAALGMVIVEAAVKTLAEMATFGEAGVSKENQI
ncbi:MAG: nicotinate-nucleotide--dimethylbenzimidazole phosphoribosyltransferase [Chloroflexi bacterium CG08_land_8_20_14_0_20_45_12]|nr:MAG: nicotinate-nucleotide--dimethylbenzimidazole phosphoribosyltransferase [Chloroflexi bacterium CG08_land_8_20_14_0_20_45_12]